MEKEAEADIREGERQRQTDRQTDREWSRGIGLR